MAEVPIQKLIYELQCYIVLLLAATANTEHPCRPAICRCMFAACLAPVVLYSTPHPSGLISQDQDDSQIYEVILTIVCVKQIIGRDEWAALAMKLHQP